MYHVKQRALVPILFNRKRKIRFQNAINTLGPLIWLKLNETTGTNAADAAGNYDGTISGTTTLGEAGPTTQVGTSYLADGATSKIQMTGTDATLRGITDFTVMALVNVSGAGEGNAGALWTFGNLSGHPFLMIRAASGRQGDIVVRYATTLARKRTDDGQLPANGSWFWLITRHNSSTKVVDMEIGQNGALATPTFDIDTTGDGAAIAIADDMHLLNANTDALTFNGYMGYFLLFDNRLADAQCTNLVNLSGV